MRMNDCYAEQDAYFGDEKLASKQWQMCPGSSFVGNLSLLCILLTIRSSKQRKNWKFEGIKYLR